tara:strand:- start:925 stop:1173 length:249 start_codon:yes stop_codon:yes gene_type:complete
MGRQRFFILSRLLFFTDKTMTTIQSQPFIGRKGQFRVSGMIVNVEIQDVKAVWGGYQFKIVPLNGSGSKWVLSDSVKLTGDE